MEGIPLADVIVVVRAALNAALLLSATSLIGHAILPQRWRLWHPGHAALQSLSVGMTATSLAAWLVGTVVGTAAVPLAVFALATLALFSLRSWIREVSKAFQLGLGSLRRAPTAALAAAAFLSWSLPNLLLPVIDSDGLRYHLALPKLFLLEGRVFLYPWDVGGAYPQGAEMLYMIGLQMGPGEVAKWLHFSVFLLSVAAIAAMVGRRNGAGLVAGLLYAATPVVFAGAGAAFVDGFVAFHIAVAALALKRRARPEAVGFALAGALWIKWTAGPAVAGCVVLALVQASRGRRLKVLVGTTLPVVLVLLPLLVRNTVAIGDPVFPIGQGLVRGEIDGVDPDLLETVSQRHREIPGPLGIPWDVSVGVVEPDEVVGWHYLLILAAAPLLWRDRRIRIGAALILPYLALGLFVHPSVRLAVPLIWALAMVGGVLASRLRLRLSLPFVLIMTGWTMAKGPRPPVSTAWDFFSSGLSRVEIVERSIPGARAAHFVNSLPPGGRVMALDFPGPFLFDRPWVAEGLVNLPPLSLWLEEAGDIDEISARLRSLDVRYLVVTPGYGGGRDEALLPLASTEKQAQLVFDFRRRLDLLYRAENVDVYRIRDK